MKELKKGDFTGIYTRDDNKPLFYTGIFDTMKDEDSRPCVFLATDPDNKNTFYRWTQSDLLKRGYYISKTGKNTIPRTAARLHIIFTHSGALDGVRATVERDMFGEWIITTETGEKYAGIVGQLRNAAFCVILKTETAEEIATRPQEGPTAPETETCGETTTSSEKAPQEATSDAGTAADNNGTTAAEKAPERPETSTPAQDTTGSDTRPPRATEDATTGNAAGDTSTPANQEPGTAAGAITGRTTTPPQNPGRACENAPGRTERATPGQVHATHAKSPPRAAQKAGRNTSRGSPDRRKVTFSAWMPKIDPIPM